MKDPFLIAILLIAVGAMVTTGLVRDRYGSSQVTNLQFNVKDIPESGLTITTPENQGFYSAVKARFGPRSAVIEPLLPFSILDLLLK